MTDYVELRKLAEGATPGPWATDHDEDGAFLIAEIEDEIRDEYSGIYATAEFAPGRADAEFIAAANPSTVLGLLDEIAALRAGQGTYEGRQT